MAGHSPLDLGLALKVLTVLLLTTSVYSQDKCRTGCHGVKPDLYKFAEGTTYKYNFEGTVNVAVSSAAEDKSTTTLKAQVLLTQLPQCNQVLRLQNVQVVGSEKKAIPNIDKPVRLNFHDGHLEDLICAEEGDTQVSLNIKRAIASLFQANPTKQYETDIFGLCPTETTTRKDGQFFIISKNKNLNKCSHRENVRDRFLPTAFNLNSEIKTSPDLSSDYSSEIKLKNGVPQTITVEENYLFLPGSVGKNGAKAHVHTKLQYTGESKESPSASCSVPKTLLFEDPHPTPAEKTTVPAIVAAIKEATKSGRTTVEERTAKGFIDVVKMIRTSKKADLLNVYSQVKTGAGFADKKIAQEFFLDALLNSGTGEAIEASVELLKKNEIHCEVMKKMVYLGLAFARHATPESVKTAMTLLDDKNAPREAYLGVGALAGVYCRQHSNCAAEEAIKQLTQKLVAKLTDGKTTNRQQENEMIYVLKAIKNMNIADDTVVNKIAAIASNKNGPTRLRVAALEAFHADACKDKFRDTAINILKDIQQDSEIRIKAYLAAVECPNGKVAQAIKKMLEDEPSLQVQGFIGSHLRNIKTSANPDKALAKQQLGAINTKLKYPVDFRRFSQNFEFSHAIDTLGMGATTEADLIYSQNSFLPRSTSLNLTTDVFGYRYNFLEINTRQENLDKILEHYFGPQGVFSSHESRHKFYDKFNQWKEHAGERVGRLSQGDRSKRDVSKAEIDSIGKQVQIKTNELNKDLDLDLSVKMLGNEIGFFSLNENSKELSPLAMMDKIFDAIEEGLHRAKNFDQTFHKNHLFLELGLSYPTSLGFPLRLDIDAASSVQLQAKGSIDFLALVAQADNTVAKLSLIPSGSVEIAGRMVVDSYFAEKGLKVASTIYTSIGGAAEFTVYDSQSTGYQLRYSLPLEKQELISLNHEVVFTTREVGHPETVEHLKFPQNKDFEVCADQLSPFIGLTFCAKINRPNSQNPATTLPFPFDGHSKFGVTIKKEDLKEYHLKEIATTSEKPDSMEYVALAEAIGNQGTKLKGELKVSSDAQTRFYIKALAFAKDFKNVGFEGKYIDTDKEVSLFLKFFLDEIEGYGKAGVTIQGGPQRFTLTPILDYNIPKLEGKPISVSGKIILDKDGGNQKYTFEDFKFSTPDGKKFVVKGFAGFGPTNFNSNIQFGDGQRTGTVISDASLDKDNLKLKAELQNSFNPDANVKVDYLLHWDPKTTYDSKLNLVHGKDLSSKTNTLTLANSLKGGFRKEDDGIYIKNHLKYPLRKVEAKFDLELTDKTTDYDVEFQYQDVKFGSELDFKINQKSEDDYDLAFEVYGIKNKLEIKSKRVNKGDKSDITNTIVVNGKKTELRGALTHIDNDEKTDYGGDLTIKVPTQSEPIKLNYGLVVKKELFDVFLKMQSGAVVLVDESLKVTEKGDANGALKINFKDVFVANGELKAVKGKGNGHIVMDFVKVGRKIKLESAYLIQNPTYNVDLTVFTDFQKDNKKKYTFASHNKADEKGLESHNSYEYMGQKFQANLKGKFDDDFMDGKQELEGELLFPNELYFAGKVHREMHMTEEEVINGNLLINLEQRKNKNTPGLKYTLQLGAKNTDIAEDIYDITASVAVENKGEKSLNGDFSLSRLPKAEDNWIVDIKSKLYGSVIPETYEGTLHSEYSGEVGSYKINAKYGPKNTLDVSGKYDYEGESRPVSGNIDFVLNTASPQLKVFKFSSGGSVAVGLKDDVLVDGTWSSAVFVDGGVEEAKQMDLKYDTHFKIGEKEGDIKNTLKFQKEDPISVALTYKVNQDTAKKTNHFQGSGAITYAKDKTFKTDVTFDSVNDKEYTLDTKVLTPNDKARNTRLQWHLKLSDDETKGNSDFKLTADGKVYQVLVEGDSSEISPSLSFKLVHPDGKYDELYAKVKKATPEAFVGDFKVAAALYDFALTGSVDAQVSSIDDFHIKASLDSAALKLDKVVLEALNKGGKGGKKILVTAKSGDKNLVSGSTNYQTRTENNKLIVEGSGSFQVKEESKTANFKYSQQTLTLDKEGEEGIDISFDATIGNSGVDAELKMTNKHFRFLNSYCEAKKQCAHVELDSKLNKKDVNELNHVLEVNVDLRKLGLSHEFGLKSVTVVKGYILDHTVDIHFENAANSKYQYSLYSNPTKAGVSLTTPKRIISVEGAISVPKNKPGESKTEASLLIYLDKKNKPNEKTGLIGFSEFTKTGEKSYTTHCGVKFTTPGLGKDLSVDYNSKFSGETLNYEFTSVIDIFNKPNQKIVVTGKSDIKDKNAHALVTIKSTGLNIDIKAEEKYFVDVQAYTFKYNYDIQYSMDKVKFKDNIKVEVSPTTFAGHVKLMDKNLVDVTYKGAYEKDSITTETTVQLYGLKPTVFHTEVKNYNTVKAYVARKDKPNDKLVFNAGFIPGQIADARAELVKDGKKIDLVHGSVKLDDANFLKSDYGLKLEDIKTKLVQPVKEEIVKGAEEQKQFLKTVTEKSTAQFTQTAELYKKNAPNFQPAREYYTSELEKVKNEFVSDKTIKNFADFLNNVFGASMQSLAEIFSKLIDFSEKVFTAFQSSVVQVSEAFEKEFLTKIYALEEQVGKMFGEIFEVSTEAFFTFLAKVQEFIDAHQSEIKGVTTSISSVLTDVTRTVFKAFEEVKTAVQQEVANLCEEIKALPVFEQIKQYYEQFRQEFHVTEFASNLLLEAANNAKDFFESKAIQDFITDVVDYLTKKIKQEPVNDAEALERIGKRAALILKSITIPTDVKELPGVQPQAALNLDVLSKLPRLVVAKSSIVNYLIGDHHVDPEQLLYNVAFNPFLWIPPFQLQAIVVQGQHIFTFDGKHLTFPGNCNYLLARDAVNGNFTIGATYTNGFLTSITLADKANAITVKNNGQCKINNAASEYPVVKDGLTATKGYHAVTLESDAGVRIICDYELQGCAFFINGYYHGQLKGLLGNGNSEPYDDFTLPNGKIVTSESDFGNSYKMQEKCAPVKTVDHAHHAHNKECTQYFASDESDLALCFPFVPSGIFRTACDHGTAANIKDTLKYIVSAYATACNSRGIPVDIPDEFVKCDNGDKARNIDDSFSVKIPAKSADIVIAIDETKTNEELFKDLLPPLIQELNKELASKKINDVEYHFIGYGGEKHHGPYHYTVAGKMTTKGKLPSIKFTPAKQEPEGSIKDKVEDLLKIFGCNPQGRAYKSAIEYPYRAQAAKIFVAITGAPCTKSKYFDNNLADVIRGIWTFLLDDDDILINVVTPVVKEEFSCKDQKTTTQVVGFNKEKVFTYADAKKKSQGSSDLREFVKYKDYCIDYTVENGGNVFITNNFAAAKGPQKKTFASVVAHQIAHQVTGKTQRLDCECERQNFYSAKNVCKTN